MASFASMVNEEGFMDQYGAEMFAKLVEATKAANNLPAEDFTFYSTFRPFKTSVHRLGERVLRMTQRLLTYSNPGKATTLPLDATDAESVADQFDAVVDVLDGLLEKVDVFFDESKGETNKPNIHISAARVASTTGGVSRGAEYSMFHGSNIRRPQLSFPDPIDNSNTHFVHKLLVKPNALVPLVRPEALKPLTTLPTQQQATPLGKELEAHISRSLGVVISSEPPVTSVGVPAAHPYEYEINNFLYSEDQMRACTERPPRPLDQTPFTFISTAEQLEALVAKLENESEIAVDLEQHSYRSFQGFCCLMQISTREEDFIIDTLVLRPLLHLLNRPFTNPRIVKVLHGADSDVVWLQRDFGVYLVNLFDTGQAARVLQFPSFALAHLLRLYCDVQADKKYQLADWRIRPLPEEMLRYAREDTHYLLFIYDKLRNELVARGNASNNLILAVLNRSKALCLRRYEKELFTSSSHLALYNKHGLFFNSAQMRVYAALYAWRDRVAREEDESPRYVLPNHMLFHIAELMPTDGAALLQCCAPIPPLVKQHLADLVLLVQRSRDPNDAACEQRPVAPLPQQPAPSTPVAKYTPSPSPPLNVADSSPVLSEEQLYRAAKWTPGRAKLAEANAGYHSGAAQLSSLLVDSSSSSSSDEDEAKEKLSKLRAVLANDPALPPSLRLPTSSAIAVPHSTASSASATPTTMSITPTTPPAAAAAPIAAASTSGENNEADEKIPQTLSEIYQLSNKNRKKNKEKKKRKEAEGEAAAPEITSPVKISEEAPEEEDAKRKKHKKTGSKDKDTMEFMREIGWVGNRPQPAAVTPAPPFKIAPPAADASAVEAAPRESKAGKGKRTNAPATAGRSFSFVPGHK